MAKVAVIARSGKKFPSLHAWLEHVEKADLPLILPAVAHAELEEQKRAGSEPSNILVDGRASNEAGIATARKRVQLFYLDVEMVARAVELTAAEMVRLYNRGAGRAAESIQIWGRTRKGGSIRHTRISGLAAVREYLTKNRHASTFIRLLGPTVPHRRKLYYTPPGASASWKNITRISRRRQAELEGEGARARVVRTARGQAIQIRSSTNVSEIITRKIRAAFGGSIYVSARWIRVPVPPWKGMIKRQQGVPAIALGWRFKGAQ